MLFEWDEEKEKNNIAKHGIDFETAARVFRTKTGWNYTMLNILMNKIDI